MANGVPKTGAVGYAYIDKGYKRHHYHSRPRSFSSGDDGISSPK